MKRWLIIEQYHDYEPKIKVVDADLLKRSNPVDARILDAKKREEDGSYGAHVHAKDEGLEEPNISGEALVDWAEPLTVERVVFLTIAFE